MFISVTELPSKIRKKITRKSPSKSVSERKIRSAGRVVVVLNQKGGTTEIEIARDFYIDNKSRSGRLYGNYNYRVKALSCLLNRYWEQWANYFYFFFMSKMSYKIRGLRVVWKQEWKMRDLSAAQGTWQLGVGRGTKPGNRAHLLLLARTKGT